MNRPWSVDTGGKAMQKEEFRPIVRTILAQLSEKSGFAEIQPEKTLSELGFTDEAAIAEFKTRVYRTVSSARRPLDFHRFFTTSAITLNSTVDAVVYMTHAAFMDSLPGKDPTRPKLWNP
jgi:hypothetical protein